MLALDLVQGQEHQTAQNKSIKDIPRNAVFIELGGLSAIISANYERIVPVGDPTAFGFRFGAGTAGSTDTTNSAATFTVMFETNFLYGKRLHFMETGLGFANVFVEERTEQLISVKLGYHYQARKGFLLKITPMYIYNFEATKGDSDVFHGIWLGMAFGYSF